jgi:hypothetical protein
MSRSTATSCVGLRRGSGALRARGGWGRSRWLAELASEPDSSLSIVTRIVRQLLRRCLTGQRALRAVMSIEAGT